MYVCVFVCTCVAMEQARRRKVRLTHLRKELAQLEAVQSSLETRGVEIERKLRGKEVSQTCHMSCV